MQYLLAVFDKFVFYWEGLFKGGNVTETKSKDQKTSTEKRKHNKKPTDLQFTTPKQQLAGRL